MEGYTDVRKGEEILSKTKCFTRSDLTIDGRVVLAREIVNEKPRSSWLKIFPAAGEKPSAF
jgi:hypothetical protein